MSHEIRTPLNSIIGMTSLLLDTPMTAEQREFTRDAYESGQGLLTVINDILDFSKMAAGRIAFEEIDFELRDVVEGAVNPLADEARKKGLELIVAIEPDAPRLLRGDPARLRQVLINLVSNAVKFTERGDVVVRASKITESPTEATLHMEVQDTGIGIAKEDQHRLFHPFTQTDASIHRKHGGTGLGLAISQQLVHQMGGKISILSAPGVGSTFWFTAKFKKQPQEAGAPPEPVTELRGMPALVVDHNPKNREILCEQLASWGMAADAAPDAEAALANLRAAVREGRPYAVVLLDMQMPEVDGVQLARRIRSEPAIAKVCLLMLSATEKPLDYDNLVAGLNIATCLIKPVRMGELYDSLRRTLSGEAPAQPEERATGLAGALAPTPKFEHLHILVAEDNAVNQKVAVRQLRKLGCVADAVVNGHEAVEAATQTPYDLILMDCEMPEMDGYDATREIRQQEGSRRHTRIVAMTAHALSGDREKCLAAGMDDYISKPVRIEALAEVISRMVAVPDPAPAVAPAPAVQNLEDGLRTAPGGREKRTS